MKIGIVGIDSNTIQLASVSVLRSEMVLMYDRSDESLKSTIHSLRKQMLQRVEAETMSLQQAEEMLHKFSFVNQWTPFELCDIVFVQPSSVTSTELVGTVERFLNPSTILCPILSTRSVHQYAAVLKHPERLVGVRFYPSMDDIKISELVPSLEKNEQSLSTLIHWFQELGIVSIVSNEPLGLLVHRLQIPLFDEAIRIVAENITDESTGDRILETNGFPLGPFKKMDELGLDTILEMIELIYKISEFDPKFRPHPTIRSRVESQRLGKKTGKGFYKYEVKK